MTRYALVTGGSRGLGRAICVELSKMGWSVIINFQSNIAAAKETLRFVEEAGGKGELMQCDVSSPQAIETALNGWLEAHPNDFIEVLINNAGIRRDNIMVFMNDDDWHSVLDTTINGFFYLTRCLVKEMMARRSGRIVNIASLSGIKGMPGQTNYSAAKAALIGATKALAQEVASRNVTVNAIAPGFISTDMTSELPVEELKKLVPMRRFGTSEDVAAAVAFICSSGAAYITGEVININGGLYT